MSGLIALGILLGVLVGWRARRVWGDYKVRRHFERIQKEHYAELDRKKGIKRESSVSGGWTNGDE